MSAPILTLSPDHLVQENLLVYRDEIAAELPIAPSALFDPQVVRGGLVAGEEHVDRSPLESLHCPLYGGRFGVLEVGDQMHIPPASLYKDHVVEGAPVVQDRGVRLCVFGHGLDDLAPPVVLTTVHLPISLPHAQERKNHHRYRERRHDHRPGQRRDRKSTRLNSSHANISYAVFCLKK